MVCNSQAVFAVILAGISFDEFQLQGEVSLDLRGMDDQQFAIFVSFAEIYNEFIYDLLLDAPAKGKRPVLKISQDKHQNYYIKGKERILYVNTIDIIMYSWGQSPTLGRILYIICQALPPQCKVTVESSSFTYLL